MMYMSSLSDVKVELLVYGWLREMKPICIKNKFIPNAIKHLIADFSKSHFDWKHGIKQSDMQYFKLYKDDTYKLERLDDN